VTGPGILARGPWEPAQIEVSWRSDPFEPDARSAAAADRAIAALRERGSPAHDGMAARLVDFHAEPGRLALELQPVRWALRLLAENAAQSLSASCVVRSADGRWLAGHRAGWLATWAGRWALGAGGSVEVGEDPSETLARELLEEWSVRPERLTIESLVLLPNELTMLIGQAWLPDGAIVTPDHEHDGFAWWPAEVASWPTEADAPLRNMAALVNA
jgi:8-oxo-dGTP pyrophosphatase MutT (NUDIX family)